MSTVGVNLTLEFWNTPAGSTSSNNAIAFADIPFIVWEYVESVKLIVLWPIASEIIFIFAPFINIKLANVWRKEWKFISSNPIRKTILSLYQFPTSKSKCFILFILQIGLCPLQIRWKGYTLLPSL